MGSLKSVFFNSRQKTYKVRVFIAIVSTVAREKGEVDVLLVVVHRATAAEATRDINSLKFI